MKPFTKVRMVEEIVTAEDGHHEVKLCEAVLKSSRAKGWVRV
jgi:hypothetical protein